MELIIAVDIGLNIRKNIPRGVIAGAKGVIGPDLDFGTIRGIKAHGDSTQAGIPGIEMTTLVGIDKDQIADLCRIVRVHDKDRAASNTGQPLGRMNP